MQLLQIEEPEQIVAIGIDLGTTNSLVAIFADGNAFIIPNQRAEKLTPSIIALKNQQLVIGEKLSPSISSIKRLMGRNFAELTKDEQERCFADEAGNIMLQLGGYKFTPVEVSSYILKQLKNQAEAHLQQTVTHAVITVPAYFDDAARNDTKLAAELAGLKVLRLINEPTAAALCYGINKEGYYLIYDLGGGTFDASLLKMQDQVFQVLATAGDTKLGGDDFDYEMMNYFLGIDLFSARFLKESLSIKEQVEYRGKILNRDQFENLIMPYLLKTMALIKKIIKEADISTINGLVLVGGASKMPIIKKLLAKNFNIPIYDEVNGDEVVALGAAIEAHNLAFGSEQLLLDVIPLSLGVELMGGVVEKIIPRNSPIPIFKQVDFTTYEDFQTAIKLHIVQGERELAKDCRSLANFELKNLPAARAGAVKISVNFSVDANGILAVEAIEKSSNIKQLISITPSYGMSYDLIKKMLLESQLFAKEDMEQKLLIETKVTAQKLIDDLVRLFAEDRFAGDEIIIKNKQLCVEQIKALTKAITQEDRKLILLEKEKLDDLVCKIL
jgi:molecular chaperone HscA